MGKERKRILAMLLVFVMVLSYFPIEMLIGKADSRIGICKHHPVHTEECGYSEAIEGHACEHVHTDDCYQIVDSGILIGSDGNIIDNDDDGFLIGNFDNGFIDTGDDTFEIVETDPEDQNFAVDDGSQGVFEGPGDDEDFGGFDDSGDFGFMVDEPSGPDEFESLFEDIDDPAETLFETFEDAGHPLFETLEETDYPYAGDDLFENLGGDDDFSVDDRVLVCDHANGCPGELGFGVCNDGYVVESTVSICDYECPICAPDFENNDVSVHIEYTFDPSVFESVFAVVPTVEYEVQVDNPIDLLALVRASDDNLMYKDIEIYSLTDITVGFEYTKPFELYGEWNHTYCVVYVLKNSDGNIIDSKELYVKFRSAEFSTWGDNEGEEDEDPSKLVEPEIQTGEVPEIPDDKMFNFSIKSYEINSVFRSAWEYSVYFGYSSIKQGSTGYGDDVSFSFSYADLKKNKYFDPEKHILDGSKVYLRFGRSWSSTQVRDLHDYEIYNYVNGIDIYTYDNTIDYPYFYWVMEYDILTDEYTFGVVDSRTYGDYTDGLVDSYGLLYTCDGIPRININTVTLDFYVKDHDDNPISGVSFEFIDEKESTLYYSRINSDDTGHVHYEFKDSSNYTNIFNVIEGVIKSGYRRLESDDIASRYNEFYIEDLNAFSNSYKLIYDREHHKLCLNVESVNNEDPRVVLYREVDTLYNIPDECNRFEFYKVNSWYKPENTDVTGGWYSYEDISRNALMNNIAFNVSYELADGTRGETGIAVSGKTDSRGYSLEARGYYESVQGKLVFYIPSNAVSATLHEVGSTDDFFENSFKWFYDDPVDNIGYFPEYFASNNIFRYDSEGCNILGAIWCDGVKSIGLTPSLELFNSQSADERYNAFIQGFDPFTFNIDLSGNNNNTLFAKENSGNARGEIINYYPNYSGIATYGGGNDITRVYDYPTNILWNVPKERRVVLYKADSAYKPVGTDAKGGYNSANDLPAEALIDGVKLKISALGYTYYDVFVEAYTGGKDKNGNLINNGNDANGMPLTSGEAVIYLPTFVDQWKISEEEVPNGFLINSHTYYSDLGKYRLGRSTTFVLNLLENGYSFSNDLYDEDRVDPIPELIYRSDATEDIIHGDNDYIYAPGSGNDNYEIMPYKSGYHSTVEYSGNILWNDKVNVVEFIKADSSVKPAVTGPSIEAGTIVPGDFAEQYEVLSQKGALIDGALIRLSYYLYGKTHYQYCISGKYSEECDIRYDTLPEKTWNTFIDDIYSDEWCWDHHNEDFMKNSLDPGIIRFYIPEDATSISMEEIYVLDPYIAKSSLKYTDIGESTDELYQFSSPVYFVMSPNSLGELMLSIHIERDLSTNPSDLYNLYANSPSSLLDGDNHVDYYSYTGPILWNDREEPVLEFIKGDSKAKPEVIGSSIEAGNIVQGGTFKEQWNALNEANALIDGALFKLKYENLERGPYESVYIYQYVYSGGNGAVLTASDIKEDKIPEFVAGKDLKGNPVNSGVIRFYLPEGITEYELSEVRPANGYSGDSVYRYFDEGYLTGEWDFPGEHVGAAEAQFYYSVNFTCNEDTDFTLKWVDYPPATDGYYKQPSIKLYADLETQGVVAPTYKSYTGPIFWNDPAPSTIQFIKADSRLRKEWTPEEADSYHVGEISGNFQQDYDYLKFKRALIDDAKFTLTYKLDNVEYEITAISGRTDSDGNSVESGIVKFNLPAGAEPIEIREVSDLNHIGFSDYVDNGYLQYKDNTDNIGYYGVKGYYFDKIFDDHYVLNPRLYVSGGDYDDFKGFDGSVFLTPYSEISILAGCTGYIRSSLEYTGYILWNNPKNVTFTYIKANREYYNDIISVMNILQVTPDKWNDWSNRYFHDFIVWNNTTRYYDLIDVEKLKTYCQQHGLDTSTVDFDHFDDWFIKDAKFEVVYRDYLSKELIRSNITSGYLGKINISVVYDAKGIFIEEIESAPGFKNNSYLRYAGDFDMSRLMDYDILDDYDRSYYQELYPQDTLVDRYDSLVSQALQFTCLESFLDGSVEGGWKNLSLQLRPVNDETDTNSYYIMLDSANIYSPMEQVYRRLGTSTVNLNDLGHSENYGISLHSDNPFVVSTDSNIIWNDPISEEPQVIEFIKADSRLMPEWTPETADTYHAGEITGNFDSDYQYLKSKHALIDGAKFSLYYTIGDSEEQYRLEAISGGVDGLDSEGNPVDSGIVRFYLPASAKPIDISETEPPNDCTGYFTPKFDDGYLNFDKNDYDNHIGVIGYNIISLSNGSLTLKPVLCHTEGNQLTDFRLREIFNDAFVSYSSVVTYGGSGGKSLEFDHPYTGYILWNDIEKITLTYVKANREYFNEIKFIVDNWGISPDKWYNGATLDHDFVRWDDNGSDYIIYPYIFRDFLLNEGIDVSWIDFSHFDDWFIEGTEFKVSYYDNMTYKLVTSSVTSDYLGVIRLTVPFDAVGLTLKENKSVSGFSDWSYLRYAGDEDLVEYTKYEDLPNNYIVYPSTRAEVSKQDLLDTYGDMELADRYKDIANCSILYLNPDSNGYEVYIMGDTADDIVQGAIVSLKKVKNMSPNSGTDLNSLNNGIMLLGGDPIIERFKTTSNIIWNDPEPSIELAYYKMNREYFEDIRGFIDYILNQEIASFSSEADVLDLLHGLRFNYTSCREEFLKYGFDISDVYLIFHLSKMYNWPVADVEFELHYVDSSHKEYEKTVNSDDYGRIFISVPDSSQFLKLFETKSAPGLIDWSYLRYVGDIDLVQYTDWEALPVDHPSRTYFSTAFPESSLEDRLANLSSTFCLNVDGTYYINYTTIEEPNLLEEVYTYKNRDPSIELLATPLEDHIFYLKSDSSIIWNDFGYKRTYVKANREYFNDIKLLLEITECNNILDLIKYFETSDDIPDVVDVDALKEYGIRIDELNKWFIEGAEFSLQYYDSDYTRHNETLTSDSYGRLFIDIPGVSSFVSLTETKPASGFCDWSYLRYSGDEDLAEYTDYENLPDNWDAPLGTSWNRITKQELLDYYGELDFLGRIQDILFSAELRLNLKDGGYDILIWDNSASRAMQSLRDIKLGSPLLLTNSSTFNSEVMPFAGDPVVESFSTDTSIIWNDPISAKEVIFYKADRAYYDDLKYIVDVALRYNPEEFTCELDVLDFITQYDNAEDVSKAFSERVTELSEYWFRDFDKWFIDGAEFTVSQYNKNSLTPVVKARAVSGITDSSGNAVNNHGLINFIFGEDYDWSKYGKVVETSPAIGYIDWSYMRYVGEQDLAEYLRWEDLEESIQGPWKECWPESDIADRFKTFVEDPYNNCSLNITNDGELEFRASYSLGDKAVLFSTLYNMRNPAITTHANSDYVGLDIPIKSSIIWNDHEDVELIFYKADRVYFEVIRSTIDYIIACGSDNLKTEADVLAELTKYDEYGEDMVSGFSKLGVDITPIASNFVKFSDWFIDGAGFTGEYWDSKGYYEVTTTSGVSDSKGMPVQHGQIKFIIPADTHSYNNTWEEDPLGSFNIEFYESEYVKGYVENSYKRYAGYEDLSAYTEYESIKNANENDLYRYGLMTGNAENLVDRFYEYLDTRTVRMTASLDRNGYTVGEYGESDGQLLDLVYKAKNSSNTVNLLDIREDNYGVMPLMDWYTMHPFNSGSSIIWNDKEETEKIIEFIKADISMKPERTPENSDNYKVNTITGTFKGDYEVLKKANALIDGIEFSITYNDPETYEPVTVTAISGGVDGKDSRGNPIDSGVIRFYIPKEVESYSITEVPVFGEEYLNSKYDWRSFAKYTNDRIFTWGYPQIPSEDNPHHLYYLYYEPNFENGVPEATPWWSDEFARPEDLTWNLYYESNGISVHSDEPINYVGSLATGWIFWNEPKEIKLEFLKANREYYDEVKKLEGEKGNLLEYNKEREYNSPFIDGAKFELTYKLPGVEKLFTLTAISGSYDSKGNLIADRYSIMTDPETDETVYGVEFAEYSINSINMNAGLVRFYLPATAYDIEIREIESAHGYVDWSYLRYLGDKDIVDYIEAILTSDDPVDQYAQKDCLGKTAYEVLEKIITEDCTNGTFGNRRDAYLSYNIDSGEYALHLESRDTNILIRLSNVVPGAVSEIPFVAKGEDLRYVTIPFNSYIFWNDMEYIDLEFIKADSKFKPANSMANGATEDNPDGLSWDDLNAMGALLNGKEFKLNYSVNDHTVTINAISGVKDSEGNLLDPVKDAGKIIFKNIPKNAMDIWLTEIDSNSWVRYNDLCTFSPDLILNPKLFSNNGIVGLDRLHISLDGEHQFDFMEDPPTGMDMLEYPLWIDVAKSQISLVQTLDNKYPRLTIPYTGWIIWNDVPVTPALPSTGGEGVTTYITVGLTMILISGAIWISRRKLNVA